MRIFVEKQEVLERLRKEVKNVAIYADNLSSDQAKSVAAFMKRMTGKYGISDKFGKLLPNTLHNQLDFYKRGSDTVSEDSCKQIEFLQLLIADEIWVFDNGYDNFAPNGRLAKKIEEFGTPVKFLCASSDGKEWEFYRGETYVTDNEGKMECHDYYIVETIATENQASMENPAGKVQAKAMRMIGSTQLSDEENSLAKRAVYISQLLGYLSVRAAVRNDSELETKINKLLRSANKVMFGILLSDGCSDAELKAYDASLDFTENDAMELRQVYVV